MHGPFLARAGEGVEQNAEKPEAKHPDWGNFHGAFGALFDRVANEIKPILDWALAPRLHLSLT
ncbi:MAG: hypothetical protein KF802_14505 [Bdellovibrionaceae bacterium]|nr:hypothetical protein [Pseudobdellovibrionaceae bacterium]